MLSDPVGCEGKVVYTKSQGGTKHDQGKPRMSLVPVDALWEVVDILEQGAIAYGENNWQEAPLDNMRYYNACHRHMKAWVKGQDKDDDSGKHHLAHALCCLFFMLEGTHYLDLDHFDNRPGKGVRE